MDRLLYELRSNPYFRAITWAHFTAKANAAGYPPSAALNRLIRRYLERGFDDGQPETQNAVDRHRRLGTYDKLPLSRRLLNPAPEYADERLVYEVDGMPEDVGARIMSHPLTIAQLTAERRTWRIEIHPSRDGVCFLKSDWYLLAGEYDSPEEAVAALEAALLRGDLAEPEGRETDPTT